MNIQLLTADFAVCGQIAPDDVAAIAADGYTTIICNRPDHEEPGQPVAKAIADACEAHGITFHHLPFQGSMLPPGLPQDFAAQIKNSDGPVLAYCRSGQRCSYLYMAARSLIAG